MKIDITGVDKAVVLAALYNAAKSQGMGDLESLGRPQMTTSTARGYLDQGQTEFDYVHGRILKIEFDGDELDVRLYDRDNGQGAAFKALKHLLKTPLVTTLVSLTDIVAFIKERNVPLGAEVEITLTDKMFDFTGYGVTTILHFTNSPAQAGIEGDIKMSDDVFFLRLLEPEQRRVEASARVDVKVLAFYVVNFNTLTMEDQSANIV